MRLFAPLNANQPPAGTFVVPAVEMQGITFSYDGRGKALDDVSLTVGQGDFLAVIGPNGGGKSTLLRLMLGLLQPKSGSVRLFGKPAPSMRGHIGYVSQFSTMQCDFPASVLDMTLMGAALPTFLGGAWSKSRDAREKALAYLELLGIGDCAYAPLTALSGGQRQRVLVARALMGKPGPATLENRQSAGAEPFLLLLDEPTASIDPEGRFCFYEFLGKLRGSVTIVVVSHDLLMVSPFFSATVFVNTTLTPLSGSQLSPENLSILFGGHTHDCPVGDMLHLSGAAHHDGCTHPACRSVADAATKGVCATCGQSNCAHNHNADSGTLREPV